MFPLVPGYRLEWPSGSRSPYRESHSGFGPTCACLPLISPPGLPLKISLAPNSSFGWCRPLSPWRLLPEDFHPLPASLEGPGLVPSRLLIQYDSKNMRNGAVYAQKR